MSAILSDGRVAKACVEFKHAHSADIRHGLTRQLPEYMRAHSTDMGFYCVLWYKGDHFDKPALEFGNLRGSLLLEKAQVGLEDVGLIFIDVAEGRPPSKVSTSDSVISS